MKLISLLFCVWPLLAGAPLYESTTVWGVYPENKPNYRIPAIVKARHGELLVFAEKRNAGSNDIGNHDLVMKRSWNQGRTWSEETVLLDDGDRSSADPTPFVEPASGKIWLFFLRDKKEYHYIVSQDDGNTWSAPVSIHEQVTLPEWRALGTKQRFGCGPGGGAIQLQAGPKAGRILVPARHFESFEGVLATTSHVFYSDDLGKTWKIGANAGKFSNESQLVELGGGDVLASMRDGDNSLRPDRSRHLFAISGDGGESWHDFHAAKDLLSVQTEASIRRYTIAGAGGKNRLLFSNPKSHYRDAKHPYGRYNMTVRLSYDEGRTWTEGKTIYAQPSSYSDIVVLDDGTVGLIYERGPEGSTHYWDELRFVRFNLDWITDGKDSLVPHQ
jgi:sialidase-1